MVDHDENEGFSFRRRYYESVKKLPDKQRLAIYDAIMRFRFDGETPTPNETYDVVAEAVFELIKPSLGISLKKSEAGSNGGKNKSKSSFMHAESTMETDIKQITIYDMDLKQSGFDEFWEAYPRKVGKGAARKAWGKIKINADLLAKILDSVAHHKKISQWKRDNGQFIPNPATWLNQSRWEDEPPKYTGATILPKLKQRDYPDDFFDRFITNKF